MYNFVSLNVKCPLCGESFMDSENLVDNAPSIKLNIKVADEKGVIRMSSIYGSYNYVCDIEVKTNSLAEFFCPTCVGKLNSKIECDVCKAEMVPFYLDIGGKVAVCSRAGCKNHLVEFDDLSNALRRLYQDYGVQTKQQIEPEIVEKPEPVRTEADEDKETLESGAFLQTYCPNCKRSLNVADMLKLKIVNDKGEEGEIMLSPYLNVFSSRSTIFLQEDKVINDIKCWHCDHSLILEDVKCEHCASPTAKISIGARTRLIDFYICSKKGCRWHGLSEDDINEIKLEDSLEW